MNVTDTPSVTLSGLVESTSYDVYVRSYCGGNDYSNPVFKTFTTSCAPVSLPFTENFDTFTPGLYAPFLPCWHRFNSYSALSYPYISDTYSHSGDNALYFYSSASTYSMAVLPMVDPAANPVNTLRLSFYMRTNHHTSQMVVGVLSDPLDYGTFVPVDTVSVPGNGLFAYQEVPLDSYIGTGRYVALCLRNTSYLYPVYVDDVTLETIPTCSTPMNVNTLNIAATAATLWWIENNAATSWNIRVNDGTTEDTVTVSANPYTLTGLTPETTYTVWVQTICDGGDLSPWSFPFTFTTLTAIDPTVTTGPALSVGQSSATLSGTVANPDNVAVSSRGFEWKATAGGSYTQVTASGDTMNYDLTGLTPGTNYTYRAFISFGGTTSYGAEVNFTTLEASCDTPTGLHLTAVGDGSISIAWDAHADVSSWNIRYRPQGGAYVSATSSTNTYTVTGLVNQTPYEIQVQAVCEGGQTSEWSPSIQATPTGIANWLQNSVTLFPNPAKEYVDIRVDGSLDVTAMEVFDVYGKCVKTVAETMDSASQQTRIHVNGLAGGTYFVRVTTDRGVTTKMFVKR